MRRKFQVRYNERRRKATIAARATPLSNARRSSMPRSRWFRASTISCWQCSPLWRRGVSCHVRTDDARSRPGVCPWARNGRLWEAYVVDSITVSGSLVSLFPGCVEAREQAGRRRRLPERDDNFFNFYCLVTNVTVLLQLGFLFIFNRNLFFSCVWQLLINEYDDDDDE